MKMPNCFRIEGARLLSGIPPSSALPLRERMLPFENVTKLSGWVHRAEVISGTKMLRALPEATNESPRLYLVYFEVPKLKFGGGPFAPGMDLWPGGEWHAQKPFWRQNMRGDNDDAKLRRGLHKAEAWLLEEGKRIILVDQEGEVRKLVVDHEGLSIKPIMVIEFGQYLAERAARIQTRIGVAWATRNLEKLVAHYDRFESELRPLLENARERLTSLQSVA